MPGAGDNQLDRSINALTIGTVKDLRKLDEQRAADGLQEIEEQFQIQVSGSAEEFASWQEVDITFSAVFIDGTSQRDSELTKPQFTYGQKLDTPIPVAIVATVMEWNVNNRAEVVGAKLAIGVLATDRATKFRGTLHASFQGWGQPSNVFMEDVG